MTATQRERAFVFIKKHCLRWAIGWASESEIDKYNITGAEMNAFHRCLDALCGEFDEILMDGSYFKAYRLPTSLDVKQTVPHRCVAKADSLYLGVACASILAKVSRDNFVTNLCRLYPALNCRYGIASNLGYPTATHCRGIQKYGTCQYHRFTFKQCQDQVASLNRICSVLVDESEEVLS